MRPTNSLIIPPRMPKYSPMQMVLTAKLSVAKASLQAQLYYRGRNCASMQPMFATPESSFAKLANYMTAAAYTGGMDLQWYTCSCEIHVRR